MVLAPISLDFVIRIRDKSLSDNSCTLAVYNGSPCSITSLRTERIRKPRQSKFHHPPILRRVLIQRRLRQETLKATSKKYHRTLTGATLPSKVPSGHQHAYGAHCTNDFEEMRQCDKECVYQTTWEAVAQANLQVCKCTAVLRPK